MCGRRAAVGLLSVLVLFLSSRQCHGETGYEDYPDPGWPYGWATEKDRVATDTIENPVVWTIAGGAYFKGYREGYPGPGDYAEGDATISKFKAPAAIAIHGEQTHSTIYVADAQEHRIRRIFRDEYSRWITELVAGSGNAIFSDGNGVTPGGNYQGTPREDLQDASFNGPSGIVVNFLGDTGYVADRQNNRIRKVRLLDGYTTTVAGSSAGDAQGSQHDNIGTLAGFSHPTSLIMDPAETYLIVSEQGPVGHLLRKVMLSHGNTSIWMGAGTAMANLAQTYMDGQGTDARFNTPAGMVWHVDLQGNEDTYGDVMYLADSMNHVIRKITVATQTVEPFLGDQSAGWGYKDGIGTEAKFGMPWAMSIHQVIKCDGTYDTRMFVVERGNHRVRVVDMATLRVTTLAGVERVGHRDGDGNQAQFNGPSGIATVFGGGGMRINYVADQFNHLIRQVPMEIEMPSCDNKDAGLVRMEWVDKKVPLGAPVVVTWYSDFQIEGTDRVSGRSDWIGLYKKGECSNTTHSNIESLHKCFLASRPFPRAGLKTVEFTFEVSDYGAPGLFEARYFTNYSSADADSYGLVCGGGIGKAGRLSLEGYYGLCWYDVFATSGTVEVAREQNYPGLMPDRNPFNGNLYSVPGLEYDSLED